MFEKQKAIIYSVIIPTYNRSSSLLRLLTSLENISFPRNRWEIVVVDNNSTDDTRIKVKEYWKVNDINISYVYEKRLSFTVARRTGAEHARGDILVYIDDDVSVGKEWLKSIEEGFLNNNIGMVGGPIKPKYEEKPPKWVTEMNGIWLSLFDLGNHIQDVERIPGPNLSIKKKVLDELGGFPPDTIGVESEGKSEVIEKIYVGPGDWGLCQKVRSAGYRIIYHPKAIVYHHIPPIRLTREWWKSRFRGEGSCLVIYEQYEKKFGRIMIFLKIMYSLLEFLKSLIILSITKVLGIKKKEINIFWVIFSLSKAKAWLVMLFKPSLASELWEMGLSGVTSNQIKQSDRFIRFLR